MSDMTQLYDMKIIMQVKRFLTRLTVSAQIIKNNIKTIFKISIPPPSTLFNPIVL